MKNKVQYMTRLAILMAIVIAFTIFNIGNIPIGPIVATIYQVPVIIGAVLLGVKAGAVLGGTWGLVCFLLALFGQTTDVIAIAGIAQNPFGYFLVAFLPRILVGILSGLVWKFLSTTFEKQSTIDMAATGVIGSLVNTIGYLGLLYLIFKDIIANAYSVAPSAVIGIVLGVAGTNGIVEAIVSGIITLAVCKAVLAVDKRYTK